MVFAKGKKRRAEKARGPAPVAKAAEIKEFKGEFKWGMSPKDVIDKLNVKIDAAFKDQVEKYRTDPAKSDSVRRQIKAEKERVAKSLFKFDGQKGGWDVSIIDQEFLQKNGESMLYYKEPKSTRYFFFSGDSLYKMFVAFDKDVVAGKSFQEFGDLMQQKYGKAQMVYRDVVLHGKKDRVLDAFQWRSAEGDGLRLVDRSKFYDVYCLVIYDHGVADRQEEVRKSQAAAAPKGSFVDSVIEDKLSDRDENDNVIDRITGKEVLKPGERRGGNQNIKVPSPASGSGEMKAEDRAY
ncbi:MAG: hypothetical protein JXP73_17355 [Deltaproteobacteria bacterium]|nr:hypothetical protein [Deltaproteobacteria bacterium]